MEDSGLTVIGVTDEGKGLTEKWVAKHGVTYPYAYDKGGKLKRWFGVRGIPHAVLIGPSGKILWRGHPGQLSETVVKRQLGGTLSIPLWEWECRAAAKAMEKGDWSKALEEARADEATEIVASIEGFVADQVATMKEANENGDYLGAYRKAGKLKKALSGMPEGDEASTLYDALKADDHAQAVIDVQEKLEKLAEKVGEADKIKAVEKIEDKVRKLKEELPGSYAEEQARALLDRLAKQKASLDR